MRSEIRDLRFEIVDDDVNNREESKSIPPRLLSSVPNQKPEQTQIMSRHRAVRNLDLEDELAEDSGDYGDPYGQ